VAAGAAFPAAADGAAAAGAAAFRGAGRSPGPVFAGVSTPSGGGLLKNASLGGYCDVR
jgi:hypothetical protein